VITIQDLDFRYRGGPFRLAIDALRVDAGETVAITGPSGSGKTTLLHLVAGILGPDAGRIEVDGTDLGALDDARRRAFRIARVGLVFQEFELLDYLSVEDNILLPYRIATALELTAGVKRRTAELAERAGIGDKLRRRARQLSQGERQRVAVCRALLPSPPLLLADEPTGNLDPENRDRVMGMLLEDAERRPATLVVVVHDHALLPRFGRTIDARAWGTA